MFSVYMNCQWMKFVVKKKNQAAGFSIDLDEQQQHSKQYL